MVNRIAKGVGVGIFLLGIAFLCTGCVASVNGRPRLFLQRGIVLTVVHTCTDRALLYRAGQGQPAEILGATPFHLALEPTIMGDRYIQVTLQSMDAAGKVAGIYVASFHVDYRSTTARTWVLVNYYAGGGSGIVRTSCSQGR